MAKEDLFDKVFRSMDELFAGLDKTNQQSYSNAKRGTVNVTIDEMEFLFDKAIENQDPSTVKYINSLRKRILGTGE